MIQEIVPLPALSDNYIYALIGENKTVALIDPGEAAPALEFLRSRGLNLQAILCTHHHADHTAGIKDLKKAFPAAQVWVSEGDRERIDRADQVVNSSRPWDLLGDKVQILEIPGHTLGQIAFFLPRLKAVFPGDTLFSCGCGRMFEGNYPQYFNSMQRLKFLPDDTQIYFGHEYTLRNVEFVLAQGESSKELLEFRSQSAAKREAGQFTTPVSLSEERLRNPFLKAKDETEFRRWREARNHW